MGKFSQTFVAYHGCGNDYQDGTNKIVPKNRRCIQQTYNPFWKKPSDVRNKVETRAQLKIKTKASRNFQPRYFKWINMVASDEWNFSSEESDLESESDTDISLANNASKTEQNLLDEKTNDKLIIDTKSEVVNSNSPESLDEETNDKLIIDTKTEESLANKITIYTFSMKNSKEPAETADNK